MIDIDALAELLELLKVCYRHTDRINDFTNVLDSMEDVVDHQRWADKLSLLRFKWYKFDKLDQKLADQCADEVDLNRCQDPEVLAEFVRNKCWSWSFGKRVRFCDKICKLTGDASMRLQFTTIRALSHLLISEKEEALCFLEKATTDYETLSPNKKSQFGDHLYAHTVSFLGTVAQEPSVTRKAARLYEGLLEDSDLLTPFGIGEYRLWLGRCYSFLGEYDAAIANYELSISANETPLAKIYLGEAFVCDGKFETGRAILTSIDRSLLSLDNLQNFAVATTILAVSSRLPADIEAAMVTLRTHRPTINYFVHQKDRLMNQLLELSPLETPGGIRSIVLKIIRYTSLKPNLFGIGLDIGNILEDLVGGRKNSALTLKDATKNHRSSNKGPS